MLAIIMKHIFKLWVMSPTEDYRDSERVTQARVGVNGRMSGYEINSD